MKFKLLFLFIILSTTIYSQNEASSKKGDDWIVKLNLPQLTDVFSFPSVQFSLEKKINRRLSLNTEIGVQIYEYSIDIDTVFKNQSGIKLNTEIRYYINKHKRNGFYIGTQIFYRNYQYTENLEYSKDVEDSDIFTDNYSVEKQVYGLNLTAGLQNVIFKNIIIEPFLGLGIGFRKIKINDLNYDREKDILEGHHNFFLETRNQNETIFNITLGFRVGYIFKN